MNMQEFVTRLMEAAKTAGIEAAEAYAMERESFNATSKNGEINEYKSNLTRGLGFRGVKNGKMGYASTEAFDDEAIQQIVRGVLESADLCEDTDEVFLYDGAEPVPTLDIYNPALDEVAPEQKLERVLDMEKKALAYDKRVKQVDYNMINTGRRTIRIVNSYGMDRSYCENLGVIFTEAIAKDGDSVSTGDFELAARNFDELDVTKVANEAAKRAVFGLHAKSLTSGKYRVVLFNEAMTSMMDVFSTIFSAETAQKGLSLLNGKLGESVAAACVTLVDDPLLPNGLESRPFDAEGVPSKKHTVVENGVFKTFLHNLKTAKKDGVATTGNASKDSYASPVHVSPSNLYFAPGTQSFDELLSAVGNGVVITSVSGLHAGANAVSGDFSLLSKGYVVKDGKRAEPVEQITVAGNFYELLSSIRAFASDLRFPNGGMGSASVDVGELSISGS